jgi:hypothetical protein
MVSGSGHILCTHYGKKIVWPGKRKNRVSETILSFSLDANEQ